MGLSNILKVLAFPPIVFAWSLVLHSIRSSCQRRMEHHKTNKTSTRLPDEKHPNILNSLPKILIPFDICLSKFNSTFYSGYTEFSDNGAVQVTILKMDLNKMFLCMLDFWHTKRVMENNFTMAECPI